MLAVQQMSGLHFPSVLDNTFRQASPRQAKRRDYDGTGPLDCGRESVTFSVLTQPRSVETRGAMDTKMSGAWGPTVNHSPQHLCCKDKEDAFTITFFLRLRHRRQALDRKGRRYPESEPYH
jgi:hypothetical protein